MKQPQLKNVTNSASLVKDKLNLIVLVVLQIVEELFQIPTLVTVQLGKNILKFYKIVFS